MKHDAAKGPRLHLVEYRLLRTGYVIGLVGVVQYAFVTWWLMSFYPGGRIGFRESIGYDFMLNFLSDLGRTTRFGQGPNPTAFGYKASLALAGACTMVFFAALCYYFHRATQNVLAVVCFVLGVIAGIGYIGVAFHPINEGYWIHVRYVQWGFIGFWCMTLCCAYCIYRAPAFPNVYARMLLLFATILGMQICIMLFGPRSWTSESALMLQVVAQKVVVYSEVMAMTILAIGALRALGRSPVSA